MTMPRKDASQMLLHHGSGKFESACFAFQWPALGVGVQHGVNAVLCILGNSLFHKGAPILPLLIIQCFVCSRQDIGSLFQKEFVHFLIDISGGEPFFRVFQLGCRSPRIFAVRVAHGEVIIPAQPDGRANAEGERFPRGKGVGAMQRSVTQHESVAAAVGLVVHPGKSVLGEEPAQTGHAGTAVFACAARSAISPPRAERITFWNIDEQSLEIDDALSCAHADTDPFNADVQSEDDGIRREKGMLFPVGQALLSVVADAGKGCVCAIWHSFFTPAGKRGQVKKRRSGFFACPLMDFMSG